MKIKHKILFFGPYPNPITGQSLSFKEVYDNYNEGKILFNTTKSTESKILNTLYCLTKLPFVFLFFNFETVYFTCSRSSLGSVKDISLLILCKIFKKKAINHLHGNDFKDFFQNSRFKFFLKWAYNSVHTSIVLLPSMRCQFSDFKKMNIEVVRNCYSISYKDLKINLNSKKKHQIIYLSNIMCSKGIFIFLESIETILETNNTVIVKVAGNPMSDYLMSIKEVLLKFTVLKNKLLEKFPKRFFYLGIVKGEEKINLLKSSDIFVLPTYHKTEAFPISIIEAMRFGNAIITTKHNFLSEIVKENNGCLIIPNSSDSLTKKINYFLNNEKLLHKIQVYNIQEAIKKYSPDVFKNEIFNIISET